MRKDTIDINSIRNDLGIVMHSAIYFYDASNALFTKQGYSW